MIRGTPLIAQRKGKDCGVAALAMFAMIAYEDAYVAVMAIEPECRGGQGLFNRDVIAAATRLGITLTPTRKFDLDDDEGVLRIRWSGNRAKKQPGGHFVTVRNGQVFCPSDVMVYPWREYLTLYEARPGLLLKGDD